MWFDRIVEGVDSKRGVSPLELGSETQKPKKQLTFEDPELLETKKTVPRSKVEVLRSR